LRGANRPASASGGLGFDRESGYLD